MRKREKNKIMHDESGKILCMLLHAFEDQYKALLRSIDRHPQMYTTLTGSEYKTLMMQCCMSVLERFLKEYPDYFYEAEYGIKPDKNEGGKPFPAKN